MTLFLIHFEFIAIVVSKWPHFLTFWRSVANGRLTSNNSRTEGQHARLTKNNPTVPIAVTAKTHLKSFLWAVHCPFKALVSADERLLRVKTIHHDFCLWQTTHYCTDTRNEFVLVVRKRPQPQLETIDPYGYFNASLNSPLHCRFRLLRVSILLAVKVKRHDV